MDAGKMAAAREASRYTAELIRESAHTEDDLPIVLGLGSGRTAELYIGALADLPKHEREMLLCIPTSEATWRAAERAKLEIGDESETLSIDLAVDGADEIGPGLSLVKGGGGALFRERVVAEYAQEFIVIADEGKLVPHHGGFPLPIEISPFCLQHTIVEIVLTINELGYSIDPVHALSLRSVGGAGQRIFKTENGNLIVDVSLGRISDLEDLGISLSVIAGVVGHGLFLDVADFALIGSADGGVRRINAEPCTQDAPDNTGEEDGKAS